MAKEIKRYDLKAADRRRNRLIQFGLTAIVIIFFVGMVLWIIKPWQHNSGVGQSINVSEPSKLVKDSAGKPKAVLSMYEDFLCPHCGEFEKNMGATVRQLISTGAVEADYYMVALPGLDRPQTDYYSSRAGNAGYCVAEADKSPDKASFQRFHDALYKQQPGETASDFPNNDKLIEIARLSGIASQSLSDCINNGKYSKMVKGLAQATGIDGTPTVKLNGQVLANPDGMTPQQLIDAVTKITGPVPGLAPPAPAPAPAPAAP